MEFPKISAVTFASLSLNNYPRYNIDNSRHASQERMSQFLAQIFQVAYVTRWGRFRREAKDDTQKKKSRRISGKKLTFNPTRNAQLQIRPDRQ